MTISCFEWNTFKVSNYEVIEQISSKINQAILKLYISLARILVFENFTLFVNDDNSLKIFIVIKAKILTAIKITITLKILKYMNISIMKVNLQDCIKIKNWFFLKKEIFHLMLARNKIYKVSLYNYITHIFLLSSLHF